MPTLIEQPTERPIIYTAVEVNTIKHNGGNWSVNKSGFNMIEDLKQLLGWETVEAYIDRMAAVMPDKSRQAHAQWISDRIKKGRLKTEDGWDYGEPPVIKVCPNDFHEDPQLVVILHHCGDLRINKARLEGRYSMSQVEEVLIDKRGKVIKNPEAILSIILGKRKTFTINITTGL